MQIVKFNKVVIPDFLNYFKNEFSNDRERELLLNLLKDCNNTKKQNKSDIFTIFTVFTICKFW